MKWLIISVLAGLLVIAMILYRDLQSGPSSVSSHRLAEGDKVSVTVASACAPDPDDFPLLAAAVTGQDRQALASLTRQGKILLLDAGTRAEILVTNLKGGRTMVSIETGEHIGKSCDLLTAQLGIR